MATTYLSRTQGTGSTDAAKKFTVSLWIKRGGLGVTQVMWSSGSGASAGLDLYFDTNNNLCFEALDGSDNPKIISDREFRDPAAWYHIVAAIDTPQATPADTVKLYVNGVQETSFSTSTYPAQDYEFSIGTASDTMKVGTGTMAGATNYWNGVMAHVHYTDGQVYAPTAFGETDATSGIWIAKSGPSVTYGDNGLFLKFASGALGTDSSGNGNTMTVTGTMTNTKDIPPNNFCTMNSIDNYYPSATFTNGNNTILTDTTAYSANTATVHLISGKWYWESRYDALSGSDWLSGITGRNHTAAEYLGSGAQDYGYIYSGGVYHSGSNTTTGYDAITSGTGILGTYLDLDNSKLYFGVDGVVQNSGTGISLVALSTLENSNWTPAFGDGGSGTATASFNFGNGYFGTDAVTSGVADAGGEGTFEYDPSAGTFDSASKDFRAICTNNLATYGG